ncbi:fungal-specific transcription factor domain-containing protein [Dipodascopsis uninucleata]
MSTTDSRISPQRSKQCSISTGDESIRSRERGRLDGTNGTTRFTGSASGIYFVKTVRNAFASIGIPLSRPELVETALIGDEPSDVEVTDRIEYRVLIPPLSKDTARDFALPFFRYFHPILPFLHGPTIFSILDDLGSISTKTISAALTIKAIFSIGLLDKPTHITESIITATFKGKLDAMESIARIIMKSDMETIQALLAIQTYLLSIMSFRAAHEVGSIVRSKILNAGIHRCPARYRQFSEDERVLRARIFWSVYCLDRYISQSLGIPAGFQDSDSDVCLPCVELHVDGKDVPLDCENSLEEIENQENTPTRISRAFVDYCRLAGRAVEIFNKSLHVRSINNEAVLVLKADIQSWWNLLPPALTREQIYQSDQLPFDNDSFFTVCYQHLLLLINRPGLSLSPNTHEFNYSMQACIACSRTILHSLTAQIGSSSEQQLFWPIYLSMVWMSGLIIVYACQTGHYSLSRSMKEINMCYPLLKKMAIRWPAAQDCVSILEAITETQQKIFSTHGKRTFLDFQENSIEGLCDLIAEADNLLDIANAPFDNLDVFNMNWQWLEGR